MLSSDLQDEFGSGYKFRQDLRYAQSDATAAALRFLAEVNKTIADRGEHYGPPLEHWGRTAELFTAYLGPVLKDGAVITPRMVALLWCLDKISRDAATPKADNILDLAGYAAGISTLEG